MSSKPSTTRRRYDQSEVTHWLREQDRECLSYQQLSLRSGIPVPTLATWRRRMRLRGEGATGFVELHASKPPSVADTVVPSPAIRVVLANGRRLEVGPGFDDAPFLARLVTLLES